MLRPAGHDDSVHGDAGRRRCAAGAGGRAAPGADANGIQPPRLQSVGCRDPRRRAARLPEASITFNVDDKRQAIIDTWPADVDDSAARTDWGFNPMYDFDRAFHEYLMPTIRRRYPAWLIASLMSMTDRIVTAFAPATVSNVGCGFDVLGFALEAPGDEVTARFAPPA